MKVVLFCGGLGIRLRENPQDLPKPMVEIGYRPLLWHVMKYYAHYGHKDFILCLGYKADVIKNYFLSYNECLSNDFILSEGGNHLQLLNSDIDDWKISFVDTGLLSNIGQRLKAVEPYLAGEDEFLANYSDGLTDLPLPESIQHFRKAKKIASFLSVRANQSFHIVSTGSDGLVKGIQPMSQAGIRINGGYFVFKKQIFDYLDKGEELVEQPFRKLIEEEEIVAYEYDGFWAAMDTFKDKQELEDRHTSGTAAWEIWKPSRLLATTGERIA